MKVGKPISKRTPVRLRHKIQKKSAAKQRKDRKAGKKDLTWRSRLKKDPGIPNLFPYKEKLLREIEEGKKRKEEEAAKKRDTAKAQRDGGAVKGTQTGTAQVENEEDDDVLLDLEDEEDEDMAMDDSSNPMAALLASARSRAAEFDPDNASDRDEMDDDDEASDVDSSTLFEHQSPKPQKKDTSRRSYYQTLNNLISTSDILLYVLDARDPQSTRSSSVEQAVLANPNKRLIFILNKIDLVPADVLKSWLLHLRRSFPTLPLRSSSSAPSAKTFDHKHLTPQSTATNLVRALKAYSTSRASTTVGIIGYPNVGKSSVINALTARLSGRAPNGRGKKDCPVGAEAGVTTALREVKLDNKIKLIDSPGVVFASSTASEGTVKLVAPSNGANGKANKNVEEQAKLVLLNAIPPHEIGDPVPAISLLLRRMGQKAELLAKLLAAYDLPALMRSGESKDITTDFLVQVARKRGRLGKGGVPNLHAAAQTVIGDWRDGRIHGWVEPPKEEKKDSGDTKEIVTEWAKEFSIDGLWGGSGSKEDVMEQDAPMVAA